MQLVRLIYVSRMTEDCDMSGIQKILEVSRKKNRAQDITGVLCYDPAFFLQCLEGPRAAVNSLYASIVQDPRHRDVLLLGYCDAESREFAEWSMAFLATRDLDSQALAQYAGGGKLDPYALSAKQAHDLLAGIVAQERERLTAQAAEGA
jgi:Sensors of blue-light using FAD